MHEAPERTDARPAQRLIDHGHSSGATVRGGATFRLRRLLSTAESDNPAKRAAERYYLVATPLWGIVAGTGMVVLGVHSSDAAYLAIGIAGWAVVLGLPYLKRDNPATRGGLKSYHLRFSAFVAVWAFCGNFYSRYFYQMFGMQYGFRTSWNLNTVPFFLYPLTAAYFTTYFTIINYGARLVRRRVKTPWLAIAAAVTVCVVVAWLETALNANPLLKASFCYQSRPWMLTIGSLIYGLWFVIGWPFWRSIDEKPGEITTWSRTLTLALASFFLVMLSMELVEIVFGRWLQVLPYYRSGAIGLVGHPGFDAVHSCLR